MINRMPVAANFYSGDIAQQMSEFARGFVPPTEPVKPVAGIVPHAGWFFSGATAAKVFMTIKAKATPDTFVLFGAVHVPGVYECSVFPSGSWETPIGRVSVDDALAERIIEAAGDFAIAEPDAHSYEHSIEVQLPMIKHLFPDAKIVPIAAPPSEDAIELGSVVGRLIREEGLNAVVIGSTDLTHYGENYGFTPAGFGPDAYKWMRESDGHIIQLATKMMPNEILTEASIHHNACGPGAMAATVAAARAMHAKKGELLEYTTSYDVYPESSFRMAVGYAGIVF